MRNSNLVYEAADGIPTAQLYRIANVAIKDWAENNNEVDGLELPYVMEVDFIKVYKMVPEN